MYKPIRAGLKSNILKDNSVFNVDNSADFGL
jgi:hypothetical protein